MHPNKPIVFYDGGCPLCRKEIDHYMRLDRSQRICWVDITIEQALLSEHGLSYQQAMARIHGVDDKGVLVDGVEVFLIIWRNISAYRLLALTIDSLRLKSALDFVYGYFARWRMRKRCSGYCESNVGIQTPDKKPN